MYYLYIYRTVPLKRVLGLPRASPSCHIMRPTSPYRRHISDAPAPRAFPFNLHQQALHLAREEAKRWKLEVEDRWKRINELERELFEANLEILQLKRELLKALKEKAELMSPNKK
jgi:hypothetical protein